MGRWIQWWDTGWQDGWRGTWAAIAGDYSVIIAVIIGKDVEWVVIGAYGTDGPTAFV